MIPSSSWTLSKTTQTAGRQICAMGTNTWASESCTSDPGSSEDAGGERTNKLAGRVENSDGGATPGHHHTWVPTLAAKRPDPNIAESETSQSLKKRLQFRTDGRR